MTCETLTRRHVIRRRQIDYYSLQALLFERHDTGLVAHVKSMYHFTKRVSDGE